MSLGRFGGSTPERARFVHGEGPAGGGMELVEDARIRRRGNPGDLTIGYWDISVRAFNSANISLTSGTLTVLTFDSNRFDTNAIHSTSTNTSRLTCNVAGKYFIFGNVRFASNATGEREFRFRLNGTTILADQEVGANGGGRVQITIMTYYDLVVGDYVELLAFQDSGGALNVEVLANSSSPEFGMVHLPL